MSEPDRAPQHESRRLNFRAGLVRVFIGTLALTLLPLTNPGIKPYVWILAVYVACAVGTQVLIMKDIGGRARMLVMGVADLAVFTFFLHRLGTLAPVLMTLYVFIGMLYALAIGLRNAQILAACGSLMVVGVLWAEATGRLPYAPDALPWASTAIPHRSSFLGSAIAFPVIFFGSVTLVGSLLEELRDRESALEQMSQEDHLTRLANRRALYERIETEVARVNRGHALVAVMIDLDRFKAINDAQGHIRGDEMLNEVARALEHVTRKIDLVGRYGGDEFLVLLPGTNASQAKKVVERLVAAVREVGEKFDPEEPVTASIGVAEATPEDDAISLLRRADHEAYEAKRAGGNRAVGL